MEAITVLVLILLSTAGARNIPEHMDEVPEEPQLVLADNIPRMAAMKAAVEISREILAETVVKDTEEEFEGINNVADLSIERKFNRLDNNERLFANSDKEKNYKTDKKEQMESGNMQFEDREALKANTCVESKRVGGECLKIFPGKALKQ